jgi:hypothetical protein
MAAMAGWAAVLIKAARQRSPTANSGGALGAPTPKYCQSPGWSSFMKTKTVLTADHADEGQLQKKTEKFLPSVFSACSACFAVKTLPVLFIHHSAFQRTLLYYDCITSVL